MNVLSLFDGISCGMVALERANIKIDKYYASEIDKYAIQVSEKNYPNIIRLGDVTNWKNWNINWNEIDLLIGGSPCQGFSNAGNKLNFEDSRSKLFFVYVDILNHLKTINPKIKFLLENVKMKYEWIDIISNYLGLEPIEINSSLVSAQNRKRLYWCNWQVELPKDKEILLKDIVHENIDKNIDSKYILSEKIQERFKFVSNSWCIGTTKPTFRTIGQRDWGYGENNKVGCLTATDYKQPKQILINLEKYKVPIKNTLKILDKETDRGKIGHFKNGGLGMRLYNIHNKTVTLCGAKTEHYLFGCITPDRINKRQNGQRFNDGNKFYTLTTVDRHGVLIDGYIRKLTPVECERLQTLPDNYSDGISDAQRYKCLGNGWTVDVVAHILTSMHNTKKTFKYKNLTLFEVIENGIKL